MGFDFEERKSLLYADLFKLQENRDNCNNTMKSQWRNLSSNYSSTCDSSSSGFTSPFGSELGSSESEDGDFAAELSRQMAECMLHEEEEEERNSVTENLKYVLSSNRPILDRANRTPCIELKNQSPVGDEVRVSRDGRVVKGAELTQQMQTQKTEQNFGRCRERDWRSGAGRKGHTGSGMRAIFLGGAGSRNGSSGTGVFLPRVTNDLVQPKEKSGLSTVLIPTRVLEALELHFKTHSDSAAPPVMSAGSPHHASPRATSSADEWMRPKGQGTIHTNFQMEEANIDEIQILPQEWTY